MGKLYDSVLTTVGVDEWHTQGDILRTRGKEDQKSNVRKGKTLECLCSVNIISKLPVLSLKMVCW